MSTSYRRCTIMWFLFDYLEKTAYISRRSTGFPAKWCLRNERWNSILMTRHYPDLGSASDWSCHVGNLLQPIRSTTQTWLVTRHQYGFSALVSQTSIRKKTSGGVAKCRCFVKLDLMLFKCIKRENSLFFCSRATKSCKNSLRTYWLWYSQKQSVR